MYWESFGRKLRGISGRQKERRLKEHVCIHIRGTGPLYFGEICTHLVSCKERRV